jgi:hypothetical protein
VDPLALEVGCCDAARVPLAVGDVLGDALVRPGRVVVRPVLGRQFRRGSGCRGGRPVTDAAARLGSRLELAERPPICGAPAAWRCGGLISLRQTQK